MPDKGQSLHWIADFETAQAILRHKAFREVTFKGLVPLLGHVIVTLEGLEHRQRRSLEGRLFTALALRTTETALVEPVIRQTLAEAGHEACLVQLSYRVMTRIAARLLGLDGLESPEAVDELVGLLGALVSGTGHGTGVTRRAARDALRLKFIDGAISRRRNRLNLRQTGRPGADAMPSDLISLLLLHTDRPWDTRQIAGEVAFYAVAAVDTTATLVPHLFHELWKYTQIYPALAARQSERDFLRLAASEALRLHPAIPTIFRQATEPVRVGKLEFETGETAGIYVTDANRDPALFGPDAGEFQPLRTLPPKTPRVGLSFGGGAHLCLGRELALGSPATLEPAAVPEPLLVGQAALLAQALFHRSARPDPSRPVALLSPFQRDVYPTYPILLD